MIRGRRGARTDEPEDDPVWMSAPKSTITRLEPVDRHPGRIAVHLDGEYAFSIDGGSLAAMDWSVGKEIPRESLQAAWSEQKYKAALSSALFYLGYRARTEKEVATRLDDRGYPPPVVAAVLRYITAEGYINDAAYAERYAETASERHIGSRRVAADLQRRGVDPEVAAEAARTIDDNTETELALEFACRRAAAMAHLDRQVRDRRLAAALTRRGFSYSTIRVVLEQVKKSADTE